MILNSLSSGGNQEAWILSAFAEHAQCGCQSLFMAVFMFIMYIVVVRYETKYTLSGPLSTTKKTPLIALRYDCSHCKVYNQFDTVYDNELYIIFMIMSVIFA